jgi:two-component system response regulator FlrC
MNTEGIELATSALAIRALNRRRAAARNNDAPIDWLADYPQMASVVALARRFAAVPTTPIVIQGERGCGVQMLARFIHREDPVARANRFRTIPARFVSVGEMRGWPNLGTVVIEDIEDLKSAGQAWVAETIAERSSDRCALRIVATTRLSVAELLQHRDLSQELVHTLDVFRLVVPPLRDRAEEIARIARAFLRHYGQTIGQPFLCFSEEAERKLAAHSYPANMCELRNVVERSVALRGAGEGEIPASAIVFYDEPVGPSVRRKVEIAALPSAAKAAGAYPSLTEIERDYMTTLIRELKGRRTEVARAMGVSYQTVLKKISRHRLDVRAIVAANADRGPAE